MCCFSGPVSAVTETRLFARWLPGTKPARQLLAYQMSHTLYCQTPSGYHGPKGWDESEKLPAALGKWNDAGLLDRTGHLYRTSLTGLQPNRDTYA
jgi:hypothetical protein